MARYRIFGAWRSSRHARSTRRSGVKAERPDARPIAGGTDLLVELNFDRARPETILNLAEVAELKGWIARERLRPARRRASPTPRRCAAARRAPARARGGVADGRLAADPQPRHDRRQPRHRLAGRRRASAAARRGRDGRARRACAACGRCRSTEFFLGPKRNALARRRAGARGPDRPERAAADVHEGRSAERDGDRRLLARASLADRERGELRAAYGSAGPVAGARRRRRSPRAPTSPTLVARSREPDRRRPRHGRLSPPRARVLTQACPGSGVCA